MLEGEAFVLTKKNLPFVGGYYQVIRVYQLINFRKTRQLPRIIPGKCTLRWLSIRARLHTASALPSYGYRAAPSARTYGTPLSSPRLAEWWKSLSPSAPLPLTAAPLSDGGSACSLAFAHPPGCPAADSTPPASPEASRTSGLSALRE